MKQIEMIETRLKDRWYEDAKWRRKETSNDARKNKRRMSQCSYCSHIQIINEKRTRVAPNPGQKKYARLNERIGHNKLREAQRASNMIYQCIGV